MERPLDHDEEDASADPRETDPAQVATLVGREIEHARGEVFRAYVRSRERARELADGPTPMPSGPRPTPRACRETLGSRGSDGERV